MSAGACERRPPLPVGEVREAETREACSPRSRARRTPPRRRRPCTNRRRRRASARDRASRSRRPSASTRCSGVATGRARVVGRGPVRVVAERARASTPHVLVRASARSFSPASRIGRSDERRDRRSRPGAPPRTPRYRAHTSSSRGLSTWQETTAYRSPDVATIGPEVSSATGLRRSTAALVVVLAAASPRLAALACASAGDPRGVRRQERPVRHDARRPRDVRLPAGRPVRVHAAALRLVPRRALPPVRPVVARRRHRAGRRRGAHGARRPRDRHAASLARDRASSPRCSTTLHPYVVWHDVHAEPRGARRALRCAAHALRARRVRATVAPAAPRSRAPSPGSRCSATRDSRSCRSRIAVYVAWRIRPLSSRRRRPQRFVVGARGARRRAVGRAEPGSGRLLRDHDRRARTLEGEQPERRARSSQDGGWIDDVPELPGAPPWPELAADLTLAGRPTSVDECAQMRLYREEVLDFWRERAWREGAAHGTGDADAVEPRAVGVGRER